MNSKITQTSTINARFLTFGSSVSYWLSWRLPKDNFVQIYDDKKERTGCQPKINISINDGFFALNHFSDIFVIDYDLISMNQFPDVITFTGYKFIFVEPVPFGK